MAYEATDNRLLARLPPDSVERLLPLLQVVEFRTGERVLEEPVSCVYFPVEGLISFVLSTSSGESTELAIIGREGLIGHAVFFNSSYMLFPAFVQQPVQAMRLEGKHAREEFNRSTEFRHYVMSYTRVFFRQVAQTALCNAHHSLEQRFCRWLLMIQDRIGEAGHVSMTQETIGNMLGVRREAVTRVANKLKARRLIEYTTRRIEIADRAGLIDASCECYESLRNAYDHIYNS